ncbi:ATP-dependent helicase [Actinomycetota bacterium]
MLTLRRQPALDSAVPDLDEVQRAAAGFTGPRLRVLGGPGTGKTTVAVETVVAAVARGEVRPDQCLVLTSTRLAAAALRERVTARVGGTTTEPLARTHSSFGFGLLRQDAALRGAPAPRLLSGPEQDVILRELMEGYAAGDAPAPDWPGRVREALGTRGFRGELRDLLMRAVEHGLEPDALAALGDGHDRPEWRAAAHVLQDYDQVTGLSAPGAFDPAWILTAAADLLEDDDEARDRVHDTLRLVVVDDAQELTHAAARMLRATVGPGARVVLIGDPDCATQTFRGADPRLLVQDTTLTDAATDGPGGLALPGLGEPRRGARRAGVGQGMLPGLGGEVPTLVLPTAYRLPSRVLEAAQRVAPKIGALGGGEQRRVAPGRAGGDVRAHLVRSVAQEGALIAGELRRAHLLEGVPYAQMAVIVRGGGRTSTLRRVLATSGVPVASDSSDIPVRDEVAVRPLLALLREVLAIADDEEHAIDPVVAVDVLTSPLGGADPVGLRRLRRELRRAELSGGGGRSSDVLLADAIVHPSRLALIGPDGEPGRRVGQIVQAGLAAHAEPGSTAETVLWAMWSASGLAPVWQRIALDGGPGAARADRDLDAVVGLFDAAAKFVDRLPQADAAAFLAHIQGQDIPGDTLVARSPAGDSVAVLTPAAAAGRQWRIVAVAGVQEGVWPDLRLRGSLLGSQDLVDVVTARGGSYRARQAAVRYDETRMFYAAITRASDRLLVTAVRSDEEQPSAYLDIVDPLPEPDDPTDPQADVGRPFTEPRRPLTLAGAVAELRRAVATAPPAATPPAATPPAATPPPQVTDPAAAQAVRSLALLAAEGVPGAGPGAWWGLRSRSSDQPLAGPGEPVRVSPSRVESFGRCGLRWFLSSRGGDGPSVGAASIGTLVHDIVAELGDQDAATLQAEVDARWGRLGLDPGWLSDRKQAEARDMVARLARYFDEAAATGWVRLGAEIAMEVAVGRAVLSGRVDRLERAADGSGLRVIDYKTGSSKPAAAEVERHPQLGVYQLAVLEGALADHGTESAGAALLQVGKAANKGTTLQVQGPPIASDEPDWARELVLETADGMAGSGFTANGADEQYCTMCPVRACCPVQAEGRTL